MKGFCVINTADRHPLPPSNRGDNGIITAITMVISIQSSKRMKRAAVF